MWLFLGTELLMFGGLFCVYASLRGNYPEVFDWGAARLDRTYGFLNTVVLILSSFTMALAVRAAQSNQQRQLVLFLSLTLVCGVDFMAVKYVEYSHKFHEGLVWGRGFRGGHEAPAEIAPEELPPGDAARGRDQFAATCAACHGRGAEGMEKLGPALRDSPFVAGLDEPGLVAFLRVGRSMDDPLNKTGVLMPARGGNPMLKDGDLANIAAYLGTLQSGGEGARRDEARAVVAAAEPPPEEDPIFRSVLPVAAAGPIGLAVPVSRVEGPPPPKASLFFAIYFCMTGLHGIHVLVGLGLIAWLRARAVRGEFGSHYFTPVDLGGLYWHLVDMIWIFLFPLFYLI
jgi:cytochrome c oxidase subunit 3